MLTLVTFTVNVLAVKAEEPQKALGKPVGYKPTWHILSVVPLENVPLLYAPVVGAVGFDAFTHNSSFEPATSEFVPCTLIE